MANGLIDLGKHRRLFRDDSAFNEFVAELQLAVKSGFQIMVVEQTTVCTAISPEETKSLLSERILRAMALNPDLLNEMKSRFESTDIIE